MIKFIYITLPNEGEVPMDLRLLKDKVLTDIEVIGTRVFFDMGGNKFSMSTNDYEEYFKK